MNKYHIVNLSKFIIITAIDCNLLFEIGKVEEGIYFILFIKVKSQNK